MEIKKRAWDNFLDAVDFESDTSNFKYDFKVMTKKYGQAFMFYCINAWEINNDIMSEEEFCDINGNIPESYFKKIIKK